MDIITRFWERRAQKWAKFEGYATFAAAVFIMVAAFTINSNKPLGFVAGILGLWCAGIRMVCELWLVDEHGDSRARNVGSFLQFVTSVFYLVWFLGLAIIASLICLKLLST